jgi:hypothetical protein
LRSNNDSICCSPEQLIGTLLRFSLKPALVVAHLVMCRRYQTEDRQDMTIHLRLSTSDYH